MSNVRVTTLLNLVNKEIESLDAVVKYNDGLNKLTKISLEGRIDQTALLLVSVFSKYADTSYYLYKLSEIKKELQTKPSRKE